MDDKLERLEKLLYELYVLSVEEAVRKMHAILCDDDMTDVEKLEHVRAFVDAALVAQDKKGE